jgi:type II secretory pathway pseudopilin PulG
MAERAHDEGFSLIEVVVCVALLIAATVAGLGVLPALAHASQAGIVRDAATTIARAALERVRAATAYYPAAGYQPDHTYALNAAATYTVAAHVHRAFCTTRETTTDVPMQVQLAYDAPADTLTATVRFPRNGCDATMNDSIAVTAQLAPSALAPGTSVSNSVGDPTQQ